THRPYQRRHSHTRLIHEPGRDTGRPGPDGKRSARRGDSRGSRFSRRRNGRPAKKPFMRLTQFAKSAGCAGKLSPGLLDLALKTLPRQNLPGVLVGYENADDAGVFQLTSDISVVQTIDYFPPIVDDPYTFGQIAAANALSDIYAMGGQA